MTNLTLPWHQRTLRWGQTNLTEIDPTRYDADFWRAHWKVTRIQGVIVNAGGIVAYYPSKFPLHRRASGLGERDLYGEIVGHAREDGLTVIARMDSNRADERFYQAHPDWFTCDAAGAPYRAGSAYISCINSPYYDEYLPEVFREIIERSAPDGFADNSWAGLTGDNICYCPHCVRRFRDATGNALPPERDWDDPVFRAWVRWNDSRRTEVWQANTAITSAAGGPDCVWVGMLHGDQAYQAKRFVNLRDVARGAKILFIDHQRRNPVDGFAENAEVGKRLHGLLGWDKLMPESTAMYSAGAGFFRATSMPEAEVRVWAASGAAGGIQPWWHHISAAHEDRRQYATADPIFRFHERHEQYLIGRQPRAQVAVAWSEQNNYFHGRDDTANTAVTPYKGIIDALRRARIPFLPVHIDDLNTLPDEVRVLVLADLAVMTEQQCANVAAFVDAGGSLLATGQTSRKDEDGLLRPDFGLSATLGVTATGAHSGSATLEPFNIEHWQRHDYLRLARPSIPDVGQIFDGFEDTGIVSFGGRLEHVEVVDGMVTAKHVPPFPFYPPELAWVPANTADTPALVVRETPAGSRVAYVAGDIDRIAGRENRPDHLRLLGNLVRWALRQPALVHIDGLGEIDCHLYEQPSRLVLHMVSTASPSNIPGSLHELVPVGPFRVTVTDPRLSKDPSIALLVNAHSVTPEVVPGGMRFEVPHIDDHEIAVLRLQE